MLYPGRPLLVLGIATLVGAATYYRVVLEERMLITAIGPAYRAYQQSVDCIVPFGIARKWFTLLGSLLAARRS